MRLFFALIFVGLSVASDLNAKSPVARRVNFRARLEPVGHRVIHGMGEINFQDYKDYAGALPATPPAIFMVWTSLRANLAVLTADLKTQMDALGSQWVIPQLGLEFTGDSRAVAAGAYDGALRDLCKGLKALDRPVYLRVGIEPNADGLWNSYPPADYVAAFRHITELIRAYPLDAAATLWQFSAAGSGDFMKWYPGDGYVDWWAISVYGLDKAPPPTPTSNFMAAALAHRKPVMITESTPAGVGVLNGQASWDAWFAGYFDFIRSNAGVKAFCYINKDWRIQTPWPQYGNSRIQDNAVVWANYQEEMRDPLYLHRGDPASTRAALGLGSGSASAGSASISARVYPNPWRADRHAGKPIIFDQWTGSDVTINIFTLSGRRIKTLAPAANAAIWDLANDSGDPVASGLYLYLIANGQGQRGRGKLAILR